MKTHFWQRRFFWQSSLGIRKHFRSEEEKWKQDHIIWEGLQPAWLSTSTAHHPSIHPSGGYIYYCSSCYSWPFIHVHIRILEWKWNHAKLARHKLQTCSTSYSSSQMQLLSFFHMQIRDVGCCSALPWIAAAAVVLWMDVWFVILPLAPFYSVRRCT